MLQPSGRWYVRRTDGAFQTVHANAANVICTDGLREKWLTKLPDANAYIIVEAQRTLPAMLRTALRDNNRPEALRLIDELDRTLGEAKDAALDRRKLERLEPLFKGY